MSGDFTQSMLSKCFPFFIAVDKQWNIVEMGPSLERTMGGEALARKLNAYFSVSGDSSLDIVSFFEKYSKGLVFLEKISDQLRFRGQIFLKDDEEVLYFLQAPIISDLKMLENKGILFTDFAMTDPVLVYLIMVQSHKELLDKSVLSTIVL